MYLLALLILACVVFVHSFRSFCCFICFGLVSFSHFGIEKRRGLECSLTAAIASGPIIGAFTCVICLNSHSKPLKRLLLTLFRGGDTNSVKISNVSKITELLSGRAGI